jgi:hypothetical protein
MLSLIAILRKIKSRLAGPHLNFLHDEVIGRFLPLTPTFSLREREQRIPSWLQSDGVQLFGQRKNGSPSPGGEGRGEGDSDVRQPINTIRKGPEKRKIVRCTRPATTMP